MQKTMANRHAIQPGTFSSYNGVVLAPKVTSVDVVILRQG